MGFLNPKNKKDLEGNLGMLASQAPLNEPRFGSKLWQGTLAVASLGLIGAAGWFALDADLTPKPVSTETVAALPQVVEQTAFTAPQDSGIGTSMASRTMQALKTPHEEKKEKARLALLNHSSGPLEVLTLEEVEKLTGIAAANPRRNSVETVAAAVVVQPAPEASAEIEAVTTSVVPAQELTIEDTPAVVELASVTDTEEARFDPPASVEVVESCIDDVRAIAATSTIYFETASAQFDANGLNLLRKIGAAVEDCPDVKVHVTGHSDSSGTDAVNLSLSWQRADNAVSALSVLGVDTSRFEPVGFGARAPASQGDSSDPNFDRRVEFVILEEN